MFTCCDCDLSAIYVYNQLSVNLVSVLHQLKNQLDIPLRSARGIRICVLRPVHDARRAAERRGAAQFGAVPRISRTCGGAAPLAAMPHRADRIQFYLCGAALGGGSTLGLRTSIQPIEKYYKIMCRFLSGNPITECLFIVNRPRRRGAGGAAIVAARYHAAQPRRVHREPAFSVSTRISIVT